MMTVGLLFMVNLVLMASRPLLSRLISSNQGTQPVTLGLHVLVCVMVLVVVPSPAFGDVGGDLGLDDHAVDGLLFFVLVLPLAWIGRLWLKARFGGRGRERPPMRVRHRARPPVPNFPQGGGPPPV